MVKPLKSNANGVRSRAEVLCLGCFGIHLEATPNRLVSRLCQAEHAILSIFRISVIRARHFPRGCSGTRFRHYRMLIPIATKGTLVYKLYNKFDDFGKRCLTPFNTPPGIDSTCCSRKKEQGGTPRGIASSLPTSFRLGACSCSMKWCSCSIRQFQSSTRKQKRTGTAIS